MVGKPAPFNPASVIMEEQAETERTINFLIIQARRFRSRFDLSKIEDQLKSDSHDDQCASVLFAVYHLLISGSIFEYNVSSYLNGQNIPISRRLDSYDIVATQKAWRGTAFENSPNIIGALSFMVLVLFFFEGFCRLVFDENKIKDENNIRRNMVSMSNILNYIRNKTDIDNEKIKTIEFVNEYRNSWHSFGRYNKEMKIWRRIEMRKGERLPVIHPHDRLKMLKDIFDVFLAVDDIRIRKKTS